MELKAGDRVELKKQHPCGGKTFTLLRVGMDFKLKCDSCGREYMTPRSKAEKSIRKIITE